MKRTLSTLAAATLILLATTAAGQAASLYDFAGLNGGGVDLNNQDNWTASTNINVIHNFSGTGVSMAISAAGNIFNGTRPNDSNFSMALGAGRTELTLEFRGRYGTFVSGGAQYRRAMFGLTVGAGAFYFGAGGDDVQNNKWLIVDGGGVQHYSSAVTTTSVQIYADITLVVDLAANSGNGSGSLFVAGSPITDLQNINLQLLSLAGYLNPSSFDGMYISSGDSGAVGLLYIDSPVPEPSTAMLAGLGLVGMAVRRRRRI